MRMSIVHCYLEQGQNRLYYEKKHVITYPYIAYYFLKRKSLK